MLMRHTAQGVGMNRWIGLAGMMITSAMVAGPALAQAKKPPRPPVQQVIPPKTVYWLSAATSSGFGIMGGKPPSAGDMMRMAVGGGSSGPSKTLNLDLGSKLPPQGPPAASHAIPPAMAMGPALALKTPRPEKPGKPTESAPPREDFERPKGRLLLFWGCGEAARPGQPVVLDFAKMAAGEIPPGLFGGERVRIAYPPSASNWPTWGGWPNDDKPSKQGVPGNASLLGAHKVTGNYTPDIDFTLAQDWMAGLDMTQTKAPSGALVLGWNGVPGATAHFAQMIGGGQGSEADGATMVFWSSSEVQTFISGLSDYIAPGEAARLVGKKQLLPASQTNCAIPKEAIAASPSGLISLVAHGPEANFVYPPRPEDPRVPWVQDWTVKARFVTRTGGIAGMDMGSTSGGAERNASKSGKPKCPANADPASVIGGAVGGMVGSAMGMFGKKKKPVDCEP
jgi:hypothetical protein